MIIKNKNSNNIKRKIIQGGDNHSQLESYNQLSETAKKHIEEKIKKEVEKALKENDSKKETDLELEIKNKNLLDKLELDALLNLNIIDSTNYSNNQKYFKDTVVGDNANPDITRMWLMHLIGGGMLASHFINKNGTLRSKKNIENDILRITSWRGTVANDDWLYQRLSKSINYYILKSAIISSFIKQIISFIQSWVYYISSIKSRKSGLIKTASLGSTLLIIYSGAIDNFPAINQLKKIPGVEFLIDQIENEQTYDKISSYTKALLSFTSILTILSALIALYDTFYYHIERDQIRKYLNEGIDESTKTKMFIFKDSFLLFDQDIKKLEANHDDHIINKLNKAHIKNQKHSGWFTKKNSFGKKIYNLLIEQLEKNNPEEFYIKFRTQIPIIPYAIYFFNQKGEPRTVRQTICAIIIGLEHIDSNTFKELRKYDIISKKRQKDLRAYSGGKSKKRKTKSNKISFKKIY